MEPRDMAATQAKNPISQFLVCTYLYPVEMISGGSPTHSPTEPEQQNILHFRVSVERFKLKVLENPYIRIFLFQHFKDLSVATK